MVIRGLVMSSNKIPQKTQFSSELGSAYQKAYDRGRERISQAGGRAISELKGLIEELENEIAFLQENGFSDQKTAVEQTLIEVKAKLAKVEKQQDKLLTGMYHRFNAATAEQSAKGLKLFKAQNAKDFTHFKGGLLNKISKISQAIIPVIHTVSKVDDQPLIFSQKFAKMYSKENIEKLLSSEETQPFVEVKKSIDFEIPSESRITPAKDVEDLFIPDLETTPMEKSSQRPSSPNVVNFHISQYAKGAKKLISNFNRSGVLAASKKVFGSKTEGVNRGKVKQLFRLELSQQLDRPERAKQLHQVHEKVWSRSFKEETIDGVPVLDMPPVEIDHVTVSLLTLAGRAIS